MKPTILDDIGYVHFLRLNYGHEFWIWLCL